MSCCERVLKHTLAEGRERKVNALVYIGDCMEESPDDIAMKAGELDLLGVPIFAFQEGGEPRAKACFQEMARLTRGAYSSFDASSAATLRELLSAVAVYAAGGYYYPGKDLTALQDEMKSYRDRGYRVVKMKIGGAPLADDLKRIEAVLKIVGDGQNLCVDVNGRFDIKTAIEYGNAIKPYNLYWYEEVGDPLDYALQAELGRHYDKPMATGENLFSHQDARNLIRFGGMNKDRDFLQFDCALSYGLVEYLRTLDVLKDHGWSSRRVVPHGGHQMSLNIAAGLHLGGNESYPDVFKPFGGFADGIAVHDSYVSLPQIPGVGFEAKAELYAVMKTLLD